MSNYKIRVNSKAESKEAQELFFELGYKWFSGGNQVQHLKQSCSSSFGYLVAWSSGCFTDVIQCGCGNEDAKEITLPELRDLVVLKRNSIDDATHENSHNQKLYKAENGWYIYIESHNAWMWNQEELGYKPIKLKPIEKPMKEYLRKNSNGTYSYIGTVRPEHVSDFMIEIPEGAEIYIDLGFRNHSFYKDNFKLCWCGVSWENTVHNSMNLEHWNNTPVLWKRHTTPEELPFIDDEPLQSLNDQYAEIETVRQSAWKKQEGGSHYKNLKIQPMQYALENKLDYAQANVVKYVTRHKEKNGKEDLLKAIHNLELMIEFYYGDEK